MYETNIFQEHEINMFTICININKYNSHLLKNIQEMSALKLKKKYKFPHLYGCQHLNGNGCFILPSVTHYDVTSNHVLVNK